MDVATEKWNKVKVLFDAALETEPPMRGSFLAQNCPDDDLRALVEKLVACHENAGSFLATPAVKISDYSGLSLPNVFAADEILASRFRILRFVGRGGMGEVYEAEDRESREHVAIKTIRPDISASVRSLDRFRREVHLAKKVTHLNVCRIFDLFRHQRQTGSAVPDIYFVSMELLVGETLAERVRRTGRITTAEALPIVMQMVSALNAIHDAGILHRDFKPGNVLLVPSKGREGVRVVVTDFGLAQMPGADLTLSFMPTVTNEAFGTPAYMSPEQVAGGTLTLASDIYSLGLVMYEILTGVRPFEADSPISTAIKRLTEFPPSPRKLVPELDGTWENVILKCLAREPADRFATAAKVVEALNSKRVTHLPRLPNVRRIAAFLGTLLFVTVLCLGSLQFWRYRHRNLSGYHVTPIYNFGSHPGDPRAPYGAMTLAQGLDGNLYGGAGGGAREHGALYKITPAGLLTMLYSFDGANGSNPYGGLTLGTDGNFYGTTTGTNETGAPTGAMTIFKMIPDGNVTKLYTFANDIDGSQPFAAPIQGADGNFYGTTCACYMEAKGYGTIYKITPSGTLSTLHRFDRAHGANPIAPLVEGTDGNFYGTTQAGGSPHCKGTNRVGGCGVIFKITPSGDLTVLQYLDGTHGWWPSSPLAQSADGDFYGTTNQGGSNNFGVVFKITPDGNLTVLHNFNRTDGANPSGRLVQAKDGNFYGTTWDGGSSGYGTLFRITPDGSKFSVLYNFDETTGIAPVSILQHTNGILYGETNSGGSTGGGVIYSFDLGLRPFVALLAYSGEVGKTISFLGQGFKGTTAVSFNGMAASFSVKSDTYLAATVPANATSGFVTVTAPSGTLTSNKRFRVLP